MEGANMKKILFIMLLIIGLAGLTACNINTAPEPTNTINTFSNLTSSQDLKKFNNIDEFRSFLSSQSPDQVQNTRGGMMFKSLGASVDMVQSNSEVAPAASGANDYSQTNVQIRGVDEADFVKNDDKYIYMIADNKLIIIDAISGKDSKIVSETNLLDKKVQQSTVKELFLNNNQVIVFLDSYSKTYYFEKYNIMPIETYTQNTLAYVYDVTDKVNPRLIQTYTISGAYYDSRMINDTVYIISQDNLYDFIHYNGPMITYAEKSIRPTIYYFDNPEQNYQMNTITSINLDNKEVVDSESFMLGYGSTLMVSEDNIYIAYQKQRYWCWSWRCTTQENDNKERFMEVILPRLQGEIKDKITAIVNKNLDAETEWKDISTEFSKFYTDLKDNESAQDKYDEMFGNIETALSEYDAKKAIENSKTIIHKISINKGLIEYSGKGSVDGRLLNQFSMDEYNKNLRVATSVDLWLNGGRKQYNNVYVLNNDMNIVGSLKNLAENESIYSTRFMGDKLFLVTFKQIDPFFVINLSDPSNPKVLGYLKIPGYSSYLHPINNTLIVGVGKETGENENGGTITTGVKISLFDVSDFNNPKEVDKYEIGLQGTDSPILYDHKAFLYSSTKNILVIPVTEITSKIKSGEYSYKTTVWNGAYVFKVSAEGFYLSGKVRHSSAETQYYYWFNQASVRRSLYLDNNLFTISSKYVKVNDLNNSLADLNTILLPYSDENPYPLLR
jgi:uncharacterized secreted protein with C-terminal beta-propeller domain